MKRFFFNGRLTGIVTGDENDVGSRLKCTLGSLAEEMIPRASGSLIDVQKCRGCRKAERRAGGGKGCTLIICTRASPLSLLGARDRSNYGSPLSTLLRVVAAAAFLLIFPTLLFSTEAYTPPPPPRSATLSLFYERTAALPWLEAQLVNARNASPTNSST